MEMESMVADSPCHGAFLIACLIRLTFNTWVHDVIPANGTVVNVDVPGPESNGIPFLNFENFLLLDSILLGSTHVLINDLS